MVRARRGGSSLTPRTHLPVLLLVAVALAPAVSAADWLQSHGDPERTGASHDPGPKLPEIAFELQLPGERVPYGQPLIIDRFAYVLTRELQASTTGDASGLTENGLFRIHLDTAELEQIASFDAPPSGLTSDGELVFVATAHETMAFEVPGGEQAWSVARERQGPVDPLRFHCPPGLMTNDVLYLACNEGSSVTAAEGDGDPLTLDSNVPVSAELEPDASYVVTAHDGADGSTLWSVDRESLLAQGDEAANGRVASITLLVDLLFVSTVSSQFQLSGEGARHGVWVVDTATGEVLDAINDADAKVHGIPVRDGSDEDPRVHFAEPVVTGTAERVFIKWANLVAYEPESGAELWELPTAGSVIGYGDHAMALDDELVYVASVSAVFGVDPSGPAIVWQAPWRGGFGWASGQLAVSEGLLYAVAAEPESDQAAIIVLDATTGVEQWRLPLDGAGRHWNQPRLALTDDAMVVSSWDGSVIVVGRTGASIPLSPTASSSYPAVGEALTIDMSGTPAGLHGRPTSFAVDWGETSGGEIEWQPGANVTHVYEQEGVYTARAMARNDAGQVSMQAFTFDVGGTPPPEPNLVETVFARQNQDLTFGVLGLLIALGGGLIAIGARRRRHGRLQRELAAIDAAAEAAVGNPGRLRAAMDERRAHCHGLLLDGKLDESQLAVLERHIDSIARQGRMGQMRELFDFLPHAMVLALEEMLADGRITAWERESFRGLLDRNDVLTTAQKRKVAAMIDGWFAEDEGGAG